MTDSVATTTDTSTRIQQQYWLWVHSARIFHLFIVTTKLREWPQWQHTQTALTTAPLVWVFTVRIQGFANIHLLLYSHYHTSAQQSTIYTMSQISDTPTDKPV